MEKFDYAIFIGRFQPLHKGHIFVFNEALKKANKLILLIGSADISRVKKNPFNFKERKEIINLATNNNTNIIIEPLDDFKTDEEWINAVDIIINKVIDNNQTANFVFIGHDKDDSTYYLDLFPKWHYLEIENFNNINATDIRNDYFSIQNHDRYENKYLEKSTNKWLQEFSKLAIFNELRSNIYNKLD